MQAYNFYASEDKLENRGNEAIKYGVGSSLFVMTVMLWRAKLVLLRLKPEASACANARVKILVKTSRG